MAKGPKLEIQTGEDIPVPSNDEIKDLNRKAWAYFKQHMHNGLGVTKEYILEAIQATVMEERSNVEARMKKIDSDVKSAIETLLTDKGANPDGSDWFKSAVRAIIIREINSAVRSSKVVAGKQVLTFEDFVRSMVQEEVQKQVLGKLKVDVKLALVEPPAEEWREIIGADEVREARE